MSLYNYYLSKGGIIMNGINLDLLKKIRDNRRKDRYRVQRLIDEPVPEEELDLVKTVLAGDFIRSVDGIFERSTRFIDMRGTDVTERLTDNLHEALATTTPADLHRLAAEHLAPQLMTVCRAGNL